MDPSTPCCPQTACPDKGRVGGGNIGIHSQKERRYRCKTCTKPFAATRGTPYYRLHKEAWLMTTVLILLAQGCPRLPAASDRRGVQAGRTHDQRLAAPGGNALRGRTGPPGRGGAGGGGGRCKPTRSA